jgi:FixJ family two-component response regulator
MALPGMPFSPPSISLASLHLSETRYVVSDVYIPTMDGLHLQCTLRCAERWFPIFFFPTMLTRSLSLEPG